MILAPWFRAAVTRAPSGPVDPPIPLTPDIWWDPADTYTDAADIGSWTAREGGLILTAPAAKPTRGIGPGDRRVTSWDRSASAYLTVAGSITARCIFVAARYTAAAAFIDYDGLIGSADAGVIILTGNGGYNRWYGATGGVIAVDGVETDTAGVGAWHVYEVAFAAPTTLGGITIGRDRNESGRHWGGEIGDIVCYEDLPAAEDRAAVREWLAARYEIE